MGAQGKECKMTCIWQSSPPSPPQRQGRPLPATASRRSNSFLHQLGGSRNAEIGRHVPVHPHVILHACILGRVEEGRLIQAFRRVYERCKYACLPSLRVCGQDHS